MSFYGNISNAGKTNLTFDRVYPNRYQMDQHVKKDGVAFGRFVLVEYDDNTFSYRKGYIKSKPPYDQSVRYVIYATYNYEETTNYCLTETDSETGYGLSKGDIVYVEIDGTRYFFVCDPLNENEVSSIFKPLALEEIEQGINDYSLNYNIDKSKYTSFPKSGWDSTIWKKSLKNGEMCYIMIGELNSKVPEFKIALEAPSELPKAPHFGENSTNMLYNIHVQPNWDFRIKKAEQLDEKILSDEKIESEYKFLNPELNEIETLEQYDGAIYYNKSGFIKEERHFDDLNKIKNEISLTPTGISGNKYYSHSGEELKIQEDIQELKVQLPSIGNTISNIYDLMYGVYEKDENDEWVIQKDRNLDVQWGSTEGNRLVREKFSTYFKPEGTIYTPKEMETLAGTINAVHDLMGMIISDVSQQTKEEALEMANTNRIYYGALGESENKNFYFKDKTYNYIPLTKEEVEEYKGGRDYKNLTQFESGKFYTYVDGNFYLENTDSPTEDTLYYLLGEPQKVNIKEWQKIDPETNEVEYSYYLNPNGDYIKDINKQHDPSKIYYQISLISNTIPKPEGEEILTLIWNPKEPVRIESGNFSDYIDPDELEENKISELHQNGLFYLQSTEEKNIFISVKQGEKYDINKQYFYVPLYAVAEGYSGSSEPSNSYWFINEEKKLISFASEEAYTFAQKYITNFLSPENKFYEQILGEDETIEKYKLLQSFNDINLETVYYTISAQAITGYLPDENGDLIYTGYYKPNEYFYWDNSHFMLSKNNNFVQRQYYLLVDKNGNIVKKNANTGLFEIEPEKITFYEPYKYYYRSVDGKDILDNSRLMKVYGDAEVDPDFYENALDASGNVIKKMIYYIPHQVYVVEDKMNILNKGAVWDKNVDPPSSVTLGRREEIYKWSELKNFARTLNTIHGLILYLNKVFKFNDELNRDNNTIQGLFNQLKDVLSLLDNFNPGDIIVIDEYGRMADSSLVTDKWIVANTTSKVDETSLNISHSGPQTATNTKGENSNLNLLFGEEFKTLKISTDAKGHVAKMTEQSLKLPVLQINNNNNAKQIIFEVKVSDDGQSLEINKKNVGEFTLEGYKIANSNSEIVASDTLIEALGKIIYKLNILNGDSSLEGSVAYQIAQIVAGADVKFDTLKEIADWILQHPETVTALWSSINENSQLIAINAQNISTNEENISNNKKAIDDLRLLVGEESVANQILNALQRDGVNIYATAEELKTLSEQISQEITLKINEALTKEDGTLFYVTREEFSEFQEANEQNIINKINEALIEEDGSLTYTTREEFIAFQGENEQNIINQINSSLTKEDGALIYTTNEEFVNFQEANEQNIANKINEALVKEDGVLIYTTNEEFALFKENTEKFEEQVETNTANIQNLMSKDEEFQTSINDLILKNAELIETIKLLEERIALLESPSEEEEIIN